MHAVVTTRPRWRRVADLDPAVDRFLPGKGSRTSNGARSDRDPSRLHRQSREREHDYLSFRARGAAVTRTPDLFETPDSGEDNEARMDELEGA